MKQLPDEARQAITEMIDKSSTSLLDDHPADRDRIASARAEQAGGAFRSDLLAEAIFGNFDAAAKNVTWDYYCAAFGRTIDPKSLHSTDDLLVRQNQETVAAEARDRFFAGAFSVLRPLPCPCCRSGRRQRRPSGSGSPSPPARKWPRRRRRIARPSNRTIRLTRGCFSVIRRDYPVLRRPPAHDKFERPPHSLDEATRERDRAGRSGTDGQCLGAVRGCRRQPAGRGAGLALQPGNCLAPGGRADWRGECQRLLPIVNMVAANHASLMALRNSNAVLVALLGHLSGNERSEAFVREVLDYARRVRQQTGEMRARFERFSYPFDHAQGPLTVAQYLVKLIPQEEEIGAVI